MKKIAVALLLCFGLAAVAQTAAQAAEFHSFTTGSGQFLMDGKPFRIISGEMHYPRIPRAEWAHSIAMAKAMGLNTVTVYVFWNEHEPKPGVYDFSGNNDVAAFIREVQKAGMYVLLRPGPYVCGEWEFGGYPPWLIKNGPIPLRTSDPKYMDPVRAWLKRLGQELAPLQYANGGAIIATQVENEYGAYGNDVNYMRGVRQALVDAGFDKTLFYQVDSAGKLPNDLVPDMLAGVNFGTSADSKSAKNSFEKLKTMRPQGPYINTEYWDGWFSHWGAPWETTNTDWETADVSWILQQGYSISIYMFQGGTSFGWMNGANSTEAQHYAADVTSYDYDSALDESGRPTAKYFKFRDAIAKATGVTPPPIPKTAPMATAAPAAFSSAVSLWKTLPAPKASDLPLTMENMGQNYGYVLYRKRLAEPVTGELKFGAVHQYAAVYVDGKLQGTVDRRLDQTALTITAERPGAQLDVLVEDSGRINYGPHIVDEQIGLLGGVTLAGKPLFNWQNYSLPMEQPEALKFEDATCTGPCFYRATLTVAKPADMYLDTRTLSKGQMWVNGHNLGRFWSIGPQGSLFVPGSWLKPGANEVVIFDLDAQPGRSVQGLDHLVIDLASTPRVKGE